ncbi:MAG: LLM class flavin-dependent oxidoreductase [Turicibacter sp.]|nr:LLM class flavin-dependent oxidoreductase [Turicibacter sp.]
MKKDVKFSVLDLVPIVEGKTARDAYLDSMELAKHVEKLGFERYWVAEHHNMPGIASAATSVVLSYIAGATEKIRVGAGGIMLPNHSPLVIAEQFGTLEAMFPGRIDLGLGRAPGSDGKTALALRRHREDFPALLTELQHYFEGLAPVKAVPGHGTEMPIWLLGSSDFSAQLAGRLGLPFAFATHFAPDNTLVALKKYRDSFVPSKILQEPYSMIAINVFASDDSRHAEKIATSSQQQFLSLIRNTPGKMPPPVDSMETIWNGIEKYHVLSQLSATVIGNPEEVREGIEEYLQETEVDELMIVTSCYHLEDRLRSYEIIANQFLASQRKASL